MLQIKRIIVKIGLLVGLITMSVSLYAQDTSYQEVLKDVEITGSIISNQQRSSTPSQTITNKQFEQMNSLSVADAAKYFSGVQIKDYGGIGGLKTISVRSLGAEHTGIVYDGLVVNDAQNGQIDLGRFPLENVDIISLHNAQAVSLLQNARSYSFASVLQIKTPDTSISDKKYNKYIAAFKTGSFSLLHPSFTLKNRKKNVYSSFHADYTYANGEYNFSYKNAGNTIKERRKNSDMSLLNLSYNTYITLKDSSAIKGNIYYSGSERGLPGAIILYANQGSQRLWDKNFFVQSSWNKNIGQKIQMQLSAKYNYSYFRYLDTAYLNAERKLENIFTQNEYYTSGVFVYTPSRLWKISYATDYFINDLHSNNKDFATPVRNTWLNNIAAQLSANKWNAQANMLVSLINDKQKNIQKNHLEYTPSLAFSYSLQQKNPLIIRAFYKKIFRMPTFNDLYYTNVGNTSLRPEFAHQFNLGLLHERTFTNAVVNKINFSSDIFYNHVKDKIIAIPTGNIGQWSMQNIAKVNIKGAEMSGSIRFQPIKEWQLSFTSNYTYQQALNVTEPSSAIYNNQIPYIPLHSGSYNFIAIHKNISFGYNALFSGYRYTPGQNSAFTYLPAWNTQDVTFSYTYTKYQSGNWKLLLELNNIFNQQYAIVNYFPMPGRNFRIGIRFST